ncbi:hypothetical protein RA280_14210 [Cupriavidus sp. CV2]|uniref:hypothetical protein n=1 Tax=Cupriavidus ulmosensis TaxID=3065913 RepID=UPI00296B1D04|nr:hypothetical protein [Cupriavidus sp. CV2]MDW3682880.1 hypothetical protein [Cupriavidus sp. CV2]
MKSAHSPPARAVSSDIEALGQKVEGFAPGRYYDQQAEQVFHAAARRWPRLARMLERSDAEVPPALPAPLRPSEDVVTQTQNDPVYLVEQNG